jgi:hypothetical protein
MAGPSKGLAIEPGETVSYTIKKFGLPMGDAVFVYKGEVTLEGQQAIYLQVTAQGFQFYDQENIYLQKQTFLPIKVERKLDIFGKTESIIERYDHEAGTVTIYGRQEDQGEEKPTVIQHKGPIHNIYGFIYHYRIKGGFPKGEQMNIQLPTRRVSILRKGERVLRLHGKERRTDFLETRDKDIQVWFSQDRSKVPYQIKGAIGFGNTMLVLQKDGLCRKESGE